MAKTRAQRKAERRAREQQESKGNGVSLSDSQAQHDTQVGRSGDVAEIEAVEAGIAAGAPESQLETPDAPKSPRGQKRELAKQQKAADRTKAADQKRREKEQLAKRQKQAAAERQRGGVTGFIASCWAELKKVQWPDRETLVQATAVTIIFVAIAAAYLGVLDAIFQKLMDVVL